MTNPLVPFLIRHCLAGVIAGGVLIAGLLVLDVAALRTLIFAEEAWWIPLGLLTFGISITFGSVAMGAGIMGLAHPDPPAGTRAASAPMRQLRLQKVSSRRIAVLRAR